MGFEQQGSHLREQPSPSDQTGGSLQTSRASPQTRPRLDSFIEHFDKQVMDDKAYLILELDEHTAVAGVLTRLAAYKNVIDNTMEKRKSSLPQYGKVVNL